jgi:hypothetical protein
MRHIRAIQLAVAFVVVALHSAASAQREAPDMAPEPLPAPVQTAAGPSTGGSEPVRTTVAPPRAWFGYQILLMDAAALGGGLLVGAHSEGTDRRQTGDVIASTYGFGMIGSFAVHAAHENTALGLAGTGARLLLPPIGAVLGVGAHCLGVGGDNGCSAPGGRGGFVVGMIAASLLDSIAFARAETYDPSEAAEGERVWYGYQTLVIDGAALATSLAFTLGRKHPDRTDNGARMLAAPYAVGILVSPWVHAFHGRIGVAFASLGLRALVPAIAAIPGITTNCAASGAEKYCTKEGAVWGLFAGSLLVAAIDIGALSFERSSPAERASASTMLLPYVLPTEDGRGVQAGFSGAL